LDSVTPGKFTERTAGQVPEGIASPIGILRPDTKGRQGGSRRSLSVMEEKKIPTNI